MRNEDKIGIFFGILTFIVVMYFVSVLVFCSIRQETIKRTAQIEQTRLLTDAAKDITDKVMER